MAQFSPDVVATVETGSDRNCVGEARSGVIAVGNRAGQAGDVTVMTTLPIFWPDSTYS